ncbi:unnamed protein product [Chilo suppressalis]|uniref:Vanin C-terminal domain-containing protein n=1 Tax=Chilo suppressalis TaxID=168631 RepID=A0ABN8B5I7_CHISP|nr:unnamed protein product [Chilo suppressalis]
MKYYLGSLVCLCFGLSLASEDTYYRAAVVRGLKYDQDSLKDLPIIREAADSKVDILVLPLPQGSSTSTFESCCGVDNYDELVRTLSEVSKAGHLYLVAHLLEKTWCQGKNELVRSNLVFDRDGHIVSVYRKPVNDIANCTSSATGFGTFTTDFGVTFGVLMEEDLALLNSKDLKGLKNFVLTGSRTAEFPYLSASRFAASWAFVNQAILISTSGVFAGQSGMKTGGTNLEIVKLNKSQDSAMVPPVVTASAPLPAEDLSLYAVVPLDLTAIANGHHETVCQDGFCCDFYLKAKVTGKVDEANYSIAVTSGVCALFACGIQHKRLCSLRSVHNNTNVVFEKISVTGDFSMGSTEYPIILTANTSVKSEQFHFESLQTNTLKRVTLEVENVNNIFDFIIYGSDTEKSQFQSHARTQIPSITPGYIISGDLDEFFDYVWIRVRIFIFVASIYVLEML